MTTQYSSLETLREAIEAEAQKWYSTGLEKFPQERLPLEIRFEKQGGTAGTAYTADVSCDPDDRKSYLRGKHVINFNLALAFENQEDFLEQTVPHEVAHIITEMFFKGEDKQYRGHGDFWKFVMKRFGKPPTRCHSYDVEHHVRHVEKDTFSYVCSRCGAPYNLSKVAHNRVENRTHRYACKCGSELKFRSANVPPPDEF